jgi:hypothetical protein
MRCKVSGQVSVSSDIWIGDDSYTSVWTGTLVCMLLLT